MTLPRGDTDIGLADDGERIGHAILTLPDAREEAPALALRFADATFLGADGRRSRGRHFFATAAVDPPPSRSVRLGPEITAHVREAELVSFVEDGGRILGTTVWEGIRVPPALGTGARLGSGGAKPRKGAAGAAPVFADRATPGPTAAAATGTPDAPVADIHAPVSPIRPARRSARRAAAAVGVIVLLAPFILGAAILAGFAGWRLEPTSVLFSGTAGEIVAGSQQVKMVAAWYARPFLSAPFLPPTVLADGDLPPWLELRATPEGSAWVLSPAKSASALAAGRYDARLSLVFPLRRVDAVAVSLNVVPAAPLAPLPKTEEVKTTPAAFDAAVCDRVAGNRFDGDHPSAAGYRDEIFDLPEGEVEKGLEACDPGAARAGAERRFGVQRGRLLAHRALLRLAAGDGAAAGEDMKAAVSLWRRGDEQGSAYAANLLGAYHDGIFNRPGHAFVVADDRIADGFWKRAMDAGNVVAERNYAAQLLAGKGVPADPAKAVGLLRDAVGKGDVHATGILGVALVTGSPSGVVADKVEGWRLVIAAQCVDKGAATLLDQKIASGEQQATSRHPCR